MYQETVSLDITIDRILNRMDITENINNYQYDYISMILNNTFSLPNIANKEYIKNRLLKIKEYKAKLENLKQLPVIEQRSKEWYDVRQSIVTASDFAQALNDGKFGNQKQFFIKKAGYEPDTFNNNLPPLKWGVMFEPVANEIYMKRYNTFIHEFGLIKHPNKDFFGASPDGITNNGIMVEIKCPFKRKITGEIPLQYYYQIQGQLDVCDLEECDYFECEFSLYSGEYDFYNDDTNVEKGMIIEYLDPVDESTQYIYSDIFYSQVDNQMVDDWIVNNSNLKKVVDIKFYKLQKLNTQRVYRNNEFIKEKIDELEEIWKKVIEYRNNKDLYNEEICSKKKVIKKQPVYAFLD
jgi:putative phage-type endonuclease